MILVGLSSLAVLQTGLLFFLLGKRRENEILKLPVIGTG